MTLSVLRPSQVGSTFDSAAAPADGIRLSLRETDRESVCVIGCIDRREKRKDEVLLLLSGMVGANVMSSSVRVLLTFRASAKAAAPSSPKPL